MNWPQHIAPRLRVLADAACAGNVADDEVDDLERILSADAEARQFYAAYCRMHAELLLLLRARRAVDSAFSGEKEAFSGQPSAISREPSVISGEPSAVSGQPTDGEQSITPRPPCWVSSAI